LREALALWRGDALQDFVYEPFAQPAITRLEGLRLVATERRIHADLELGRHADVVPELHGLLRQHPALRPATESPQRPLERTELRNPYKGLRPFDEDDATDFFGRDTLVGELLERLGEGSRFVCVLGASGSGKSSAVEAGLVPALRAGALKGSADWTYGHLARGSEAQAGRKLDDLAARAKANSGRLGVE
jgi:hypothetical protein